MILIDDCTERERRCESGYEYEGDVTEELIRMEPDIKKALEIIPSGIPPFILRQRGVPAPLRCFLF